MKLSEYSDEDLIEEVLHRGIELKVKVHGVEVSVFLGGVEMEKITCKELTK